MDGGRVFGSEIEYGITTPDNLYLSPIVSSTHVVVAYGTTRHPDFDDIRARWNYEAESPLDDVRGYSLKRYHQAPVIDPNAVGVANVVCANGARFYVDHAHPEYSAPETSTAHEALLYDLAGDVIARQAIADVAEATAHGHSFLDRHDPCPAVSLYRNNTDGKGASFGTHENYLYPRTTAFESIVAGLVPFFVTRPLMCGAGRVGLGQRSQQPGFQISQRADFMEQVTSLETTLNRGIINTRDEAHADRERFGRLHVIVGDANQAHVAGLIKFGATALVLDAIDQGVDFSDLQLKDPVAACTQVSYDLELNRKLLLADGRELTALEIQREYLRRTADLVRDESTRDVHAWWGKVLDLLENDLFAAAPYVDWVAKWKLISDFVARGLSIDDPKIQALDVRYADIDPQASIYHALRRRGLMHELFSDEEISAAAHHAPVTTRAFARGHAVTAWGSHIESATWDRVVVKLDDNSLATVLIDDPRQAGKETAEEFFKQPPTRELLEKIASTPGFQVSFR